jgi:hypothetical protein
VSAVRRPSQEVVFEQSAVEKAHVKFTELEKWLLSPETLGMPLHDVEEGQEKRAREVMRLLLQAHLDRRGTGDVGRALEVAAKDDEGGEIVRRQGQKRMHTREIHSVFGEIKARRTAYYEPGGKSVHPLDQEASLPKRTFSYVLQRRLCLGAIQGPFDEAVERVEESAGVRVSKRSAEDVVREAAQDFDAFYAQRIPPAAETTGPIVVAAADCKGIPMVKPEEALRVVRPGKGKKANKKRMATVAAVFTQEPRPRTPEEVVESLFYEGPRLRREAPKPRVGPEFKRVWASLEKEKKDVLAEVACEVQARDPAGSKTLALVVDGEKSLQQGLLKVLPRGVEILDLMHALERLWKIVYRFHEEGSDEGKEWVRARTLRILQGKVSQVIKGIRQSATKRGLTGEDRDVIDKATAYLYRNRHRMRYDDYLRQGLPIASGSVEGACKNLVKDRFERSGMRWTIPTAEAVLRLRAAYRSGDFDEYWRFHVLREQERLHPEGSWRVVAK